MLRIRIDGGALTTEQLRVIGQISVDFARDTADITDRQNVQLHWIRIEDVPEIWRRLEAVGLHTTEACGDCPRVILGSPVAGIAADEIIDPTPAIRDIVDRYIGDPQYSNLPRKFKTAITGHPAAGRGARDQRHRLRRRRAPRARPRLRPVGRRRAVHQPDAGRTARRLGAAGGGRRGLGRRRRRSSATTATAGCATRARIKFLVADWGAEKFREVLETEYLKRPLIDGPAPATPDRAGRPRRRQPAEGRPVLRRALAGGRPGQRQQPGPAGRPGRGARLAPAADDADAEAAGARRPDERGSTRWSPAPRRSACRRGRDAWRRSVMACTGIEFCKLAIVETKAQAARVVDELERRLGALDSPITVHINGCPNSCARIQVADIGLKGQLVLGPDGDQVEGFQVHLGGGLGLDAGFGRKLRGHKVTADELPDYVERVARGVRRRARRRRAVRPVGGAGRRGRPGMSSQRPHSARQPAGGHVLPVLRRGDAVPAGDRRLGMPQLPAGVLGDVPRSRVTSGAIRRRRHERRARSVRPCRPGQP